MKRLLAAILLLLAISLPAHAATIISVGSGAWATGATWVGGSAPADGDDVVIASGHSVQMNADTSAMTGLGTVTVTGTLYWKDGADGYLKLRTGKALTGAGYLLANSDGVWATDTALANTSKAVIDLQGTAEITATNLNIKLLCTNPTLTSVRIYETKYDFTASASTVSVANDTIDLGTSPPSEGTPVMITTASGTLPGGLQENYLYYVRAVSGNTCKLATQNADARIVDITSTGSGTCTVFTGVGSGSATVNVLDNVTADAPWSTTAGHNRVVVADVEPVNRDIQITTLTTINAGTIVLDEALDSAQYPGARIWLSSRNVSVRQANNSTSQSIINSGSNGILQCEIVATAATAANPYCRGVNYGSGNTISGTVTGCNNGVYSGSGHIISGVVTGCAYGVNCGSGLTISGVVTGCNNGVYFGSSHIISGIVAGCANGVNYGSGHIISGIVAGCTYGVNYGSGNTISGTVTRCANGVYFGSGHIISGIVAGCSSGAYYAGFTGIGMTLTGNTTDVVYSGIAGKGWLRDRIFNYAGTANDTRAWSAGGSMATDSTVYPGGKTYSQKFTFVDATYRNVMEYNLDTVVAGKPITIITWVKHDATSLAEDARLHVEIIDPGNDPMMGGTVPLAQTIAADSTDWQRITVTYTPTSERPLIYRVQAKRRSGNAWFTPDSVRGAGGSNVGGGSRIMLF